MWKMRKPRRPDPEYSVGPATAESLLEAGFDPDEWTAADGNILGHDIEAEQVTEADMDDMARGEEAKDLFGGDELISE